MEDFIETIEEAGKIKLRLPKKDRNYKTMLDYAKRKGVSINDLSISELEFFGYINNDNDEKLNN